jgi:methylamine---glutamate N-methyltransferase subunit B
VASDGGSRPGAIGKPPIVVPELRDYHQINAELVRRLNLGESYVRLEGVEGHRLLVARVAGDWHATIEIDGNAGPELAAELNAPGLTVVCRGSAADGAGRALQAGKLLVLGHAGVVLGYFQYGGLIIAAGDAGARAGLCQSGGALVLLGAAGPLTGERQMAGRLFLKGELAGPHLGHGRRGGDLMSLSHSGSNPGDLAPEDQRLMDESIMLVRRFSSPA